jgi:phasin family protein
MLAFTHFPYEDVAMSSFQAAAGFPFATAHYGKAWSYVSLAPLNLKTLLEAYEKNVAALSKANQAAFEGLTTLIQRQAILFSTTADECGRGMNDVLAAASLEEKARRQADTARHTYESTVARFGELYEIATKAQFAAVDILNARLTEALDEFKVLFAAPAEPAPAPVEEANAIVAEPVEIVAAPVEPAPEPTAEPDLVNPEPVATTAEPLAQIEEPAEDDDPDDPIAPRPTRRPAPRTPRTSGPSGTKAARRPRSGG